MSAPPPVVEVARRQEPGTHAVYVWCPGCNGPHALLVGGPRGWTWNGDRVRPTFSPSLLVNDREPRHPTAPRCHSLIEEGNIRFLADSEHELAGQTVPLPPWPW